MNGNHNSELTVGYVQGALRTGLLMAGVGVAVFILEDLIKQPIFTFVLNIAKYVALIIILRAGLMAHRKDLGGYMSFGRGFLYTLVALLLSSLLATVVESLYINFINPDYMAQQAEKFAEMIEDLGISSPELENIEELYEEGAGLRWFSSNLFSRGLISLLVSSIAALIMKRDRPLIAT